MMMYIKSVCIDIDSWGEDTIVTVETGCDGRNNDLRHAVKGGGLVLDRLRCGRAPAAAPRPAMEPSRLA